MSDRGPILVETITAPPEKVPAILAVLADHFQGELVDGALTVDSFGSNVSVVIEDGTIGMDNWVDNQDNYGNAEHLMTQLVEAGGDLIKISLTLYDGTYVFRAKGGNQRVDVGDEGGNLYVTQQTLDEMLAKVSTLAELREKLDAHFGTDWP